MGISMAPGYAAGLEDGRILIYDLINFDVTTDLNSPVKRKGVNRAVKRMCLIMPPDDPKPCFYICALYQNIDVLQMMLHSVCYRGSYRDRETHTIRFKVRNLEPSRTDQY